MRLGVVHTTLVSPQTGPTISPRVDWAHGFADASFTHLDGGNAIQFSAREARSRPLGKVVVIGVETTLDATVIPAGSSGRLQTAVALGRSLGPVGLSAAVSGGVLRDVTGTFSPHFSVRGALTSHGLAVKAQRFDGGSRSRYTDIEATAGNRIGIVSLAGGGGWRFANGGHEQMWALQMTVQPLPQAGIELAWGKSPPAPEGFPSVEYYSAGVRLTAAPRVRRPAIERTATGARVAFAVSGREVTIAGDWNDWTPVAMTRDAAGRWTAELPLRAGAHRFVLTVDGKQVVPRGVPKLPDGFGGEVGLLVIG